MNMLKDDWQVGQPVWAALGTVGWWPALVVKVARKWITVFIPGRYGYGKRLPEQLKPRNLGLKGKDKPEPLKEEKDGREEANPRRA